MFIFATVLLAISVLSANAGETKFTLENKEVAEKCSKDIGITLDSVEAIINNDIKEVDEKFKCFIACVLKGRQMLKDDGSIDIAKVIKDLPDDIKDDVRDAITKTIEKCGQKKESNECDTVFNAYQCVKQDLAKFKS